MGVSEALYIPAGLSLIADYHAGKSRSFAVGIHMTGLYLGQAVGGFGATLAEAFSWQQTFHWFGIIGVLYAVLLIFCLHEKRQPERASESVQDPVQKIPVLKGFGMIFSTVAFWIILFFFASTSLPGWATKNWLPELLANVISNSWGIEIGKAMDYAGPIAVISLAGASFIGAMIGGRLSDKWVQTNVRGRVYISSIGLALIVPSLVFMGLGDSMFAVILAILCFGIGYGFFDTNNMPILCQFIPSRQRATAYGFINMSGVLGGAAITTALGNLSLGAGFALLGGVTVLSLLIQLIALRPKTINME
jgi:MFS family permease